MSSDHWKLCKRCDSSPCVCEVDPGLDKGEVMTGPADVALRVRVAELEEEVGGCFVSIQMLEAELADLKATVASAAKNPTQEV